MRRIDRLLPLFCGAAFLLAGCGLLRREIVEGPPQPLRLDVVYPRTERGDSIFVLPRMDSTFALGSVQPLDAQVWVNDVPANVWQNGAFLAYFPIDTLNMQYRFLAKAPNGDSLRATIPFQLREKVPQIGQKAEVEPFTERIPVRITILDDHAVMRTAPNLAYWLFPPPGCVAMADSFARPYYRVALCQGLHAWVEDRFVAVDSSRADSPSSVVNSTVIKRQPGWTQIKIPLKEPLLFNLSEKPGTGTLILDLYGAVARMDQINYDPQDSLIRDIRWNQVQDDLLRLEICTSLAELWGYGATYEGANLILNVRHPPKLGRRLLEGRIIALDAGHGGQETGAIGPTRLAEKEPNLNLALKLQKLLEREGARVVLTRKSDSTLALYKRIEYALSQNAEILLSLHNNALPDGQNPFVKRGSSVYYYRSQSLDLAWSIHHQLLKATGLTDDGFYYKNLAMIRITELPAVLIESAFIIHPEEEMLLHDDRFLDRVAQGIMKGIKDYLRQYKQYQRYGKSDYSVQSNIIRKPIWNPIEPVRQND